LITEQGGNRVIEVNDTGNIVWEKLGLNNPYDAERLSNGNTLITEYSSGRILEVDSSGNIAWQKSGLYYPCDAERLDNGNTLIVETGPDRVIEIDTDGDIIWELSWLDGPIDAERIIIQDDPPSKPVISGPASGKPGDKLTFTFTSIDPNGDEIVYYIDWGDGNDSWTNFFPSGQPADASHTWYEKGTYTIKAKAIDSFGEESGWGEHVISLPKNKMILINSPILNIIENILDFFLMQLHYFGIFLINK
jgi:hypothetical protein